MRHDVLIDDARSRGYIVARDNKAEQQQADAWYAECMRTRQPFARVVPRRKWATIIIDLLPTGRSVSGETVGRMNEAIAAMYGRLPWQRWVWCACGNYTQLGKVPIDRAEELAAELLRIVGEEAR